MNRSERIEQLIVEAYAGEVRSGEFPGETYVYRMVAGEVEKLQALRRK